jgi:1,4-dihydroxy-2-naphthoate octaprenyltransferase
MSFIAYAAGAFGAEAAGYGFDRTVFWIGYAWLFFIELSTVLSNDYFDFNTDKQNEYYGPFTGGSRVIVDQLLTFRQMSHGIIVSLLVSFVIYALILFTIPGSVLTTSVVCAVLFILALGYTVPPIKLSYRGLGELTVGVTHSFAVIICGYLFQGGQFGDQFPWLLGLPLLLSVFPSIIIAGIPDYNADKQAGKGTLAVRLGKKNAAAIAMVSVALSITAVILFQLTGIMPGVFNNIIYGVLPHAALLIFYLWKYIKNPGPANRVDGLLIIALTYLMWFAVVPFLNLWK